MIDNLHYIDVNLRLSLYILLREKRILMLLEKRVFHIVNPKIILVGIWVFNSQFVNEIKNASTNKAFKKSCLVMQAYNDFNKDLVLTQLSTIE